MAKQILTNTQSTSEPFLARGCNGILLEGTVAGQWRLEIRLKEVTGASWTNYMPTLSWSSNRRYQVFDASEDLEYRLTGGTVGATAYLVRLREEIRQ